jgi:MraZ protein
LVEIDAQGRVLIPALLRETAKIQGEVAVVGNLTYLEVQSIEAYRKDIEENPFTAEDEKTLDQLGI